VFDYGLGISAEKADHFRHMGIAAVVEGNDAPCVEHSDAVKGIDKNVLEQV
jgi:hypothetical protein